MTIARTLYSPGTDQKHQRLSQRPLCHPLEMNLTDLDTHYRDEAKYER